jgi:hypothetical protein
MVADYTLGNGLSATLAAEMRRTTQIAFAGTQVAAGSTFPGQYGGFQVPDIVANIRVDQAWGSAQIMGALHQVNANYYTGATGVASGHPSDEVGFAIGAGIKLNASMISQGDFFQAQVNYTQGATNHDSAAAQRPYRRGAVAPFIRQSVHGDYWIVRRCLCSLQPKVGPDCER